MTLTPGIYKATVRGVPDTIVLMTDRGGVGFTSEYVCGEWRTHLATNITNARPLILLVVPGDARDNHWPRLAAYLRNGGWDLTADQIEAQTKPPRIEEPGRWGVVEAGFSLLDPVTWVRDQYGWTSHSGMTVEWCHLIDPVLVREGVS